MMNEYDCKNINQLILEFTTKRYKNVKDDQLQQLYQICGDSELYISRLQTLLLDNLKKPHSEIRFNTFYIFSKFFEYFHHTCYEENLPLRCFIFYNFHRKYDAFRKIAVENLKNVLELIIDVNGDTVIPPPKAAAAELQKYFLMCINRWVQQYGSTYCKLKICYEFLKRKKHVDFGKLELEDLASKRKREQEKLKKQRFDEEKLRVIRKQIEDSIPEIRSAVESLKSCLTLLVPTPEEFFLLDHNSCNSISKCNVVSEPDLECYRETGILKGNFSLNVHLDKDIEIVTITETDENSVIIENAKDHFKLLEKRHINTVKNWVKQLTLLPETTNDLKLVIDLKQEINKLVQRYMRLRFEKPKCDENMDSDTEQMEEVVVDNNVINNELKKMLQIPQPVSKPSTSKCDSLSLPEEEFSRKEKLLQLAPKVPFDVDLYHWEDESLSTPLLQPVTAEGRHFWSVSTMEDSEGLPDPDGIANIRTRIIEFTGKFEPVKWSCRFPLPNGKLCPRMDRVKCPFHGLIIARDCKGQCIDPENKKKDLELQAKLTQREIEDPQILAQIKATTGIDLKKGKCKKNSDGTELTDIRKIQNTVYRRLEKKLFRRSTVKKVARRLDDLDQRRHRDKYGDQFQYVHNTTTFS